MFTNIRSMYLMSTSSINIFYNCCSLLTKLKYIYIANWIAWILFYNPPDAVLLYLFNVYTKILPTRNGSNPFLNIVFHYVLPLLSIKLGKTRLRPESMFYNKSQISKHLKLKFLRLNLMNSNSVELNRQPVTTLNCELKEFETRFKYETRYKHSWPNYHKILISVLRFESGRNLNQWLTLHRRGSNSLNSVSDPPSYHTRGRI